MCAIFRSTIKGLKVTHLNNRRFDEQRVKTEKKNVFTTDDKVETWRLLRHNLK